MAEEALELERAMRFYAEEVRIAGGLRDDALVEAVARVPRERFLGPGPWKSYQLTRGYQLTPDADPRHVYHNVTFSLDESAHLNNGQPSFVCGMIDELGLGAGERVVHVGCGTGYYTALMAELVGAAGHVSAYELHPELSLVAQDALEPWCWAEVCAADGAQEDPGPFDAMLVNAGATHVCKPWLDRMREGGRLVLPLTVEAPVHTVGAVLRVEATRAGYAARFFGQVGIFGCRGARDPAHNKKLGRAFSRGFGALARIRSLRRDLHEESEDCWLHADGFCLSARPLSHADA